MTSSISGHLRRSRRSTGKQSLERWLAIDPPRADLFGSYAVRAYSDCDGDPVLSIDVVPTTEALSDSERRRRLFTYIREHTLQARRQAPGHLKVVNVVSR